ncbi:transposase [Pelagicoccus sp. SDUM812002]|uniref:REP-associated tyrosine transposase n=1 Tax=Pelagicoccus sp. SDUM812002 TaxID=3041266 RepID=UPI00280D4833|nr:transposase [Pelagicoccus sp. SDUM812002]MDQ8186867.1 transposase [Pelagicoccus sp. SDUM812002]
MLPTRQTHRLSHHRVSHPGANYFLTINTKEKLPGVTQDSIAKQIKTTLRALHQDEAITLLCGTIMPDHLHLLLVLGNNLTLSQTISKFKNATRKALAAHTLYWHRNYYDHRIRHQTNTNAFARYIFLNPYRKALLPADQLWPHWLCNRNYTPDFQEQLNPDSTPPAAWIQQDTKLDEILSTDKS